MLSGRQRQGQPATLFIGRLVNRIDEALLLDETQSSLRSFSTTVSARCLPSGDHIGCKRRACFGRSSNGTSTDSASSATRRGFSKPPCSSRGGNKLPGGGLLLGRDRPGGSLGGGVNVLASKRKPARCRLGRARSTIEGRRGRSRITARSPPGATIKVEPGRASSKAAIGSLGSRYSAIASHGINTNAGNITRISLDRDRVARRMSTFPLSLRIGSGGRRLENETGDQPIGTS